MLRQVKPAGLLSDAGMIKREEQVWRVRCGEVDGLSVTHLFTAMPVIKPASRFYT